jgi:hypothetical protein
MGYNAIVLYCEDTFEVEGEPFFGYMRGRYSIAEMKEIDAYGQEIGMEVIPCIQTLAHLETYLRWKQVPRDNFRTLMVGEERIYTLIDHMFATLSKCFRTKNIHIGMDEAHMLGRGAYLDKNGYEPKIDIVKKHLAQGHDLDREKLIKELGDVAWYLAETAYALDVPLEDVLQRNIDKLKARYPQGFETVRSIERTE